MLATVILLNEFEARYIKKLVYLIAFSEIYDIIWLFLYAGHWSGSQRRYDGFGDGLRHFSLFFTVINLLAKVVIAAALWKISLVKQ